MRAKCEMFTIQLYTVIVVVGAAAAAAAADVSSYTLSVIHTTSKAQ